MKLFVILLSSLFIQSSFAQKIETVDVAEITVRIGGKGEEELHYGFAEGDQIIFSFREADEKEVKEVEIIELPENSKFKDYEAKEIKDKVIKVTKKGIYKFRFYNSALFKSRICKVKIQRIPKTDETLNFNTGVKWVEKLDTTYDVKTETVVTGYNTVNRQESKKVLVSMDTNAVTIVDRLERVNSTTKLNGSSVAYVNIQLPNNSYSPNVFNPYRKTEVISWAYSIAVGGSGQMWYKNAQSKTAARSVASTAMSAGFVTGGTGALAVLAIEGFSAFSNPPEGDNVKFSLETNINGMTHVLQQGNSVTATGRVTDFRQGGFSLRLENDNLMDGINVDVKVVAVSITTTFKDEYYTVQETEPIKEKKTFKVPKVTVRKVLVFADSQ